MMCTVFRRLVGVLAAAVVAGVVVMAAGTALEAGKGCEGPIEVRVVDNGRELLVLGSIGREAVIVDRETGKVVRSLTLAAQASGAAVRGGVAYITTNEPAGRVLAVNLATGKCTGQYRVGHSPVGPVLSGDGRILCVANRFDNTVSIIDLKTGSRRDVGVVREPVALAISGNGKRLFVANHLPRVEFALDDENPYIAAEISVVDVGAARVIRNIKLPNGSQGLRGIAMSPDARYVVATHILSHYTVPARTVDGGAMNMNAISLIDAGQLEWVETVMLDDPNLGAANPWAVRFSDDGRRLLVTHAGTNELSVIDFPSLIERVRAGRGAVGLYDENDLHTMEGIRRRIALPVSGPRSLAVDGGFAYVGGYFSDNVAIVKFDGAKADTRVIPLVDKVEMPAERLGEMYFNDASICRGRWQSCGTCHPDGRNDSLYWDLANDGTGNTKSTKSLLMSALTPPLMWRGVRSDVSQAIAAGITHIEFAKPEPERVAAIEKYLLSMKTVASPYLDASRLMEPKTEQPCVKCHSPEIKRGMLTEAAKRGKAIFEGKAGCVNCHKHPFFTTMQKADSGLGTGVSYDIPTLIEAWRTGPYLHSGDALTLRQTITDFNFMQQRGHTKDLSAQELDDLLAYLKSL